MPAKSSKSRIAKTPTKQGFQFRWWMGLVLVGIVVVVGVIVVRFSHAGGPTYPDVVKDTGPLAVSLQSSGLWRHRTDNNISARINSDGTVTCALVSYQGWKGSNLVRGGVGPGSVVTVQEIKTTGGASCND